MSKNIIVRSIICLLISFWVSISFADWSLDQSASTIHFTSIKKTAIGEVHHFSDVKGNITKNGALTVNINLASVNTGIGIRDERMKDFLFETKLFPRAVVSAEIDNQLIKSLKIGDVQQKEFSLVLDLHGHKVPLKAIMAIALLMNDRINAYSVKPILLNAADFALMPGISKLQELAGLSAIASSIPVSIQLQFQKINKAN